MEIETALITHAGFERNSIYMLLDKISDRGSLRKARKVSAAGLRGPDDLLNTGHELYCPGGIIVKCPDGYLIAWELRRWIDDRSVCPDITDRLPGWKHLLEAGYRISTSQEVGPLVGWIESNWV